MSSASPQPHHHAHSHRHGHDHAACISDALSRAEAHCAATGAKLTPIRRRVLELIWQSHKPAGAYDLLAQMGGDGQKVAPPTVYRALDFLVEQGLVHRVESLNAFIGCTHPGHVVQQEIFICKNCGTAIEINDPELSQRILQDAKGLGFTVERQTIEVVGLCRDCR
ncbi:Fur family transcriptional regulator [Ferrovibrio sp.]|uniref:Fur family transcriptional regulator n=1 Tax=Ferrovibrio sp. TaxID=1917215 RepID=UPI00262D85DC|nr:Fur family transcriptional regulator [Ferrovibrio sp.]